MNAHIRLCALFLFPSSGRSSSFDHRFYRVEYQCLFKAPPSLLFFVLSNFIARRMSHCSSIRPFFETWVPLCNFTLSWWWCALWVLGVPSNNQLLQILLQYPSFFRGGFSVLSLFIQSGFRAWEGGSGLAWGGKEDQVVLDVKAGYIRYELRWFKLTLRFK